jgi:hypothetical protein
VKPALGSLAQDNSMDEPAATAAPAATGVPLMLTQHLLADFGGSIHHPSARFERVK